MPRSRIQVVESVTMGQHFVRLSIDDATFLLTSDQADDVANRLRDKALKIRKRLLDAAQDAEAARRMAGK